MKYILSVILILISSSCATKLAPEQYALQLLEPWGGGIERPISWYFKEENRSSSSITWVISKEKQNPSYENGMSIQLFNDTESEVGMSAKDFIKKNIELREKDATVISRCESVELRGFTKQCLEVEETQLHGERNIRYHVLYSFYFSHEANKAAVVIAGSPIKNWQKNKAVFDHMLQTINVHPNK